MSSAGRRLLLALLAGLAVACAEHSLGPATETPQLSESETPVTCDSLSAPDSTGTCRHGTQPWY